MAIQTKRSRIEQTLARLFQPIIAQIVAQTRVNWQPSITESTGYQTWRQQFMRDRLRLTIWIAILCFSILSTVTLHLAFFNPNQFNADIITIFGDAAIANLMRQTTVVAIITIAILLVGFIAAQRTRWAQRHPALMFLVLSLSLTLPDHLVGTYFRFPVTPNWTLEFLGQALLIPVCWRLHLLSQLIPIAYYAIIYPALGITTIGDRSIYDAYTVGEIANLFLVCLICDVGVYLYERLQCSEFDSRQQLRMFLHSVSHDLKTPVMGTSIVLDSLLKKPGSEVTIKRAVLERLLQGSDRQLTLINSLLEAHDTEVQGMQLNCAALPLRPIVDAVVMDLTPMLLQNQITLENHVSPNLPLVWADANQLWRVYCNLISNALKHNPHQITVKLRAEVIGNPEQRKAVGAYKGAAQPAISLQKSASPMLRCTVEDTGVGIEPHQCQRLFDLYFRGARARYMPGLGLGLYLCKQAIAAHGGQIGVVSQPGKGSTFWFTLPIMANDVGGRSA